METVSTTILAESFAYKLTCLRTEHVLVRVYNLLGTNNRKEDYECPDSMLPETLLFFNLCAICQEEKTRINKDVLGDLDAN